MTGGSNHIKQPGSAKELGYVLKIVEMATILII